MEPKKTAVIALSVFLIFLLVFALINALPYSSVKELDISQILYMDKIEFKATNPTVQSIIFPQTEFQVYVDNTYFGKLNLNRTEIGPSSSVLVPGNFEADQNGFDQLLSSGSLFHPSTIKYKGTATIEFMFFRSPVPFELEKNVENQTVYLGRT